MKVEIVSGEHAGKKGVLEKQTIGTQTKLANGPSTEDSVTVLVEGILHPVELDRSEVKLVHESVD